MQIGAPFRYGRVLICLIYFVTLMRDTYLYCSSRARRDIVPPPELTPRTDEEQSDTVCMIHPTASPINPLYLVPRKIHTPIYHVEQNVGCNAPLVCVVILLWLVRGMNGLRYTRKFAGMCPVIFPAVTTRSLEFSIY